MSLPGRKHRIVCSDSLHDTADTMETVDIQFKLQGGHNTGPSATEYYRDLDETGTETWLEESAPTPVAVEYTKSAQLAGDDVSCMFFSYWATQGGAATAPTNLETDSGVYEHVWNGPATSPTVYSFSMQDQGDPGAAGDEEFNRDVHNVTPERTTISGSRRGLITVAADLRGGKSEDIGGAPTAGTFERTKLFNFGMVHLFTSTTTGQASVGTTFFAPAGGLDNDTEVLAVSDLDGSPVSLTAALQEFSLECIQELDLQRSYAPGNLTTGYAGYVPKNADWVFTNTGQQCELEMVFRQNDAAGSNLVETLLTEYEAGTVRAWELWLVHTDPQAPTAGNDAYFGFKASFYRMGPISWAEENDGFGERFVRVRYRAQWDATNNTGWNFAAGSTHTTALGG